MRAVGDYELEAEIARGGLGVVYRAHRRSDGQAVAVKMLSPETAATEAHRTRLSQEAAALRVIEHPAVVRLFEANVGTRSPWLAMELIDGQSLGERLRRDGPLDLDDALRLARTLAKALDHCHQRGVLHRDLKPDNVLVRRDGSPVLVDFGLTRQVEVELSRSRLTRTGTFVGTPGYWSPEQANGEHDAVGPATDVYGLGATLFALLTGRPPYAGSDLFAVLDAMDQPPPRVSTLRPEVPRPLVDLLARCLCRDPAERPSLEQVAAQLGLLRRSRPASATSKAPPFAIALGVLLCGGLGAGWLLFAADPTQPRAPTPAASATPTPPADATPRPTPSAAPLVPPADVSPPPDGSALLAEAVERAWRREPTQALALAAVEAGGLTTLESALAKVLVLSPEEDGDHVDAVLALDPDHAYALSRRAMRAFNAGDQQTALRDMRRVVEVEPERAQAWSNLGTLLLTVHGDTAGAVEAYDRAIAIDPDHEHAIYQRGRVRQDGRDLAGALADYDRALALSPERTDTYHYRAGVKLDLGDPAGALPDAQRANRARPTVDGFRLLGRIHNALGDPVRAEAMFDRALERNPDDWKSLINRAALREARGDATGLIADVEHALRAMPADSPYRAQTAALLRKARNEQAARDGAPPGSR